MYPPQKGTSMDRPINILLIDDDENLCIIYENLLKNKLKYPFILDSCTSSKTIGEVLSDKKYDIIILDQRLDNGTKGIDLIPTIKQNNLYVYIIMNSAYGSEDLAINAMRNGANDYVAGNKDDSQSLVRVIQKGIEITQKIDEIEILSVNMKNFSKKLDKQCEEDLKNAQIKFTNMKQC